MLTPAQLDAIAELRAAVVANTAERCKPADRATRQMLDEQFDELRGRYVDALDAAAPALIEQARLAAELSVICDSHFRGIEEREVRIAQLKEQLRLLLADPVIAGRAAVIRAAREP